MSPEPPLPPGVELRCDDLVEVVTDYLEGSLPAPDRRLFEDHLATCAGCTTVVAQWRETIRQTGRLAADDIDDALDPATHTDLLAAFRHRAE